MINLKDIFLKISLIVNILLIFFGYALGNLYIIQIIATVFAILGAKKYKFKISKDTNFWILALACCAISVLFSIDPESTSKFVLMILCLVIVKIVYENEESWQKFLINGILIAGAIHVLATFVQFIAPSFIASINVYLLDPEVLKISNALQLTGAYAGIAGQTGMNAFYVAIFIAVIFLKLLINSKYTFSKLILLALGLGALLLTGKRGMLLFTIIAMFLMMIYLNGINKKKIMKYVLIGFAIIVSMIIVITVVPEAKTIFEKSIELQSQGTDITNGRRGLWEESLDIFKNNIIFGIGFNTIVNVLDEMSHNVYVQLLAEGGTIGFIVFVGAFISSLSVSFKKFRQVGKLDEDKGEKYKKKNAKTLIVSTSIYIQLLFLLYCFSGNPLYGVYFVVMYIIAISLANSLKSDLKKLI